MVYSYALITHVLLRHNSRVINIYGRFWGCNFEMDTVHD